MADVKESALTQQSDCKWVRALDSNGNSIKISKEDLASVVGGLLPGYPTNISHRAIRDCVFYLKITGFLNGIVYYTSTGDVGGIGVIAIKVDGDPASINVTNITNPLAKIIPVVKSGDTSLFFKCEGVALREFKIKLYGDSKTDIGYTIIDSIE